MEATLNMVVPEQGHSFKVLWKADKTGRKHTSHCRELSADSTASWKVPLNMSLCGGANRPAKPYTKMWSIIAHTRFHFIDIETVRWPC